MDTNHIYYLRLNNFFFKFASDWSHVAIFAVQSCNVATSESRSENFFIWLIGFFYLFLYISLHIFLIPNNLIQIQIFQIRNLKQKFVNLWSSFKCNFWIKFKYLISSTFVKIEESFLKSVSLHNEDQDLFNYKSTHLWLVACVARMHHFMYLCIGSL